MLFGGAVLVLAAQSFTLNVDEIRFRHVYILPVVVSPLGIN